MDNLKVAIVGCGQIADAHLQEIRKVPCAEVVAVCDREPELARQAAARFQVSHAFASLEQMLRAVSPDVVHVTTPPHTHYSIVTTVLNAGVHSYVEKPFTLNAAEAHEIIERAAANNCYVCVGHDQLFDPIWQDCRRFVLDGKLGDIVHVDSVQGYDLTGPFGTVLASEPDHWVHGLPGGLFHNTISHPLYKITDFLTDARPSVWAKWFDRDGYGFPTELRVLLSGQHVTGQLFFSSAMRPKQRVVRVYGTREAIEVDFDAQILRRYRAATLPGAFGKLEAPWWGWKDASGALGRNMWRFFRCKIHFFAGMKNLFEAFYRAILDGSDPPIAPSEILRVTDIMDKVFWRCKTPEGQDDPQEVITEIRQKTDSDN